MKVKVCGITNLEDALMCEAYGANALGFIFYKKSKRYVEPDKAVKIIRELSPFTMKVGVFVNETPELINEMAANIKLNTVQLHGEESPEIVNKILLPVIKSFRITDTFNFLILSEYNNCRFLFDSFSSNYYGGTGKSFDWMKIPDKIKNDIILSGGISANNIKFVINNINPKAIDISSSLEECPGKKDKNKVSYFFSLLKSLRSEKC
ncbi:MAG: phosphoribosylanthranilate isomerase [Bacteroidetes bacterium]|nr:phosphoribosylanthranilate isomerase [Bacteroidota bacterium]